MDLGIIFMIFNIAFNNNKVHTFASSCRCQQFLNISILSLLVSGNSVKKYYRSNKLKSKLRFLKILRCTGLIYE